MELITEITVPTADVAKVNRMVGHVEDVNKAMKMALPRTFPTATQNQPPTYGKDALAGDCIYAILRPEDQSKDQPGHKMFLNRSLGLLIIEDHLRVVVACHIDRIDITIGVAFPTAKTIEWVDISEVISWGNISTENPKQVAHEIAARIRTKVDEVMLPYVSLYRKDMATPVVTRTKATANMATFLGEHITLEYSQDRGMNDFKMEGGSAGGDLTWIGDRPPIEDEICWLVENSFPQNEKPTLRAVQVVRDAAYDGERDGKHTITIKDLGRPSFLNGVLKIAEKPTIYRGFGGTLFPRNPQTDLMVKTMTKVYNTLNRSQAKCKVFEGIFSTMSVIKETKAAKKE